jgi:pyruvate/2-oxoglutarate dehydrogenase complex dihydrolipoamide dehydrogenase (E3) component
MAADPATDRATERADSPHVPRVVIVGAGPAGYEAALVAAQLGAQVTIVAAEGAGGACVLHDCVPSKTFIASSDAVTAAFGSAALGVRSDGGPDGIVGQTLFDVDTVHRRVRGLALAQSADITRKLESAGVRIVRGRGWLLGEGRRHRHLVAVSDDTGDGSGDGNDDGNDDGSGVNSGDNLDSGTVLEADTVLLATGATPRKLPGSPPDGERILDWRQVYDLTALPEHLVIIGSGVTGAEFASAYQAAGVRVTLISSRDRVMPHEDSDAATLLEKVFTERGMTILNNSRAGGISRTADGVVVELTDGREVPGSHALVTVGSVPNTKGLGLEEAGVDMRPGGYVAADRVSRTSVPGIYAAGDCTGVLMLASVAAMQGRIAMWHALGEAVTPLRLRTVSANVFTDPEIATVGVGQATVDAGEVPARTVTLPLTGNARAKMQNVTDGFVKLFCRPASGLVIGGVVVAPRASELIMPIALAVENHLTVEQVAKTITIYPSLSGSLAESARQLMQHEFE